MDNSAEMLSQVFDQIPNLLDNIQRSIKDWIAAEYTGTADEGQIVAVVSAAGELTSISISPLSKRRLDNLTLGDAIAEAIRNAEQEAQRAKGTMFGELEIGGMRVSDIMENGPAAAAQKLIERDKVE